MGITSCWNCNGTGWVLDMPCNQPGCNAPADVRAPVSTIDYDRSVAASLTGPNTVVIHFPRTR